MACAVGGHGRDERVALGIGPRRWGRRCPRRAIRHRSPKGVIGAGAGVCRALREDGGGAVGEVGAGLAHAHGLWGRGESTRVAAA